MEESTLMACQDAGEGESYFDSIGLDEQKNFSVKL